MLVISELSPVDHRVSKMEGRHYFELLINGFTEWLERLNYAKGTTRSRARQLSAFFKWVEERGIQNLQDIKQEDLEQYNMYLHNRPLKSKTIEGYISVLKLLNKYLENYGEVPIVHVKLKVVKGIRTERTILTRAEINQLYEACENDVWGMRDRVILAVYYGCGLRCTEGARLRLTDIDFTGGLLHVRKGKNYRARYVPMSRGVIKELKSWIEGGQQWFGGERTNILLPNSKAKESKSSGLNKRLKRLCKKAEINKRITLHCLRHSIATHLLSSGMALEKIAQFLGHQGLEATQIYTRVINENG